MYLYDDSLKLIEQLQSLHPVYRLEVLEEVIEYFEGKGEEI